MHRFWWLVCSLFFFSVRAGAQAAPGGVKQPRILLLLDASSSMRQPWSGEGGAARYATATRIIEALMDSVYSVNPNVEFGLRVYGHQYGSAENNCYDTRREVAFTGNNRTQMSLRLASLRPQGVSPVAYSIRRAVAEDLEDEQNYSYSLILVTDGGESCSGDICAVTRELLQRKVAFFKPYVIGLTPAEGMEKQLECVGRYLQVTRESELRPAVGTIVEDYRKVLTIARATIKPLASTVTAPQPRVPKPIEITLPPPVREPRVDIAFLRPATSARIFPLRYGSPVFRQRIVPRFALPATERAAPEPAVAPLRGQPSRPFVIIRSFARASRRAYKPATFALPKFEADPVAATPPVVPPVKRVDTPPPAKPVRTVTTKPVTTPPPALPGLKETTASITAQPAAESGLEIYFTDGHGTYYKTSPQMLLLDAKTGTQVQKFYRTVGPSGNPDLRPTPPGRYDVVVAGRANLVVRGVAVEASKKTRVEIKVSRGSLRFGYIADRTRPMTEFEALVNRRFAPGPVIRQRCTAVLEYEPGNYYIEVNTTPISRHNIDLEFGVEMEILIPEPGWVLFTNSAPVGFVALYHQLGDKFVRFAALTVDGRTDMQKMRLQPGAYEAHWISNPNMPYAKESVQTFQVKSDKVTEVELK